MIPSARTAGGRRRQDEKTHGAEPRPRTGETLGRTGLLVSNLLIGGAAVAARDAVTYDHLDPITNRVATRAAAATRADAVEAANVAAAAFPAWSTTPPAERTRILMRAADILIGRADEFVAVMADETGASEEWARFNCRLAESMMRDAAARTDSLTETEIPLDRPGTRALAVRQPVGVVLGMAPWNAPIVLGVRSIAVPLACANTVVLKASELCPKTHSLIIETVNEAGLPDGTANLVTNAPDQAEDIADALIGHAAVRRVNFTGSTRVGRRISELCARHLKPCVLELSGKAPLIILDDADLDVAVNAAAFGAFFNQGQICMATERIIVDNAVADDFLARFVAKTATLQAGDPRQGDYPLGSMISRDAAVRVKGLVDDAVGKGAVLAAGGQVDNTIMQATILDGVTSAMRIYAEESFGPVAAVIRVDGDEEALAVANDTEYGLAGAVYSRDVDRAMAIARLLETGICHINGATIDDDPRVPFGGTKASGYGRFGGEAGVHEFTELRWLTVQDGGRVYPI